MLSYSNQDHNKQYLLEIIPETQKSLAMQLYDHSQATSDIKKNFYTFVGNVCIEQQVLARDSILEFPDFMKNCLKDVHLDQFVELISWALQYLFREKPMPVCDVLLKAYGYCMKAMGS